MQAYPSFLQQMFDVAKPSGKEALFDMLYPKQPNGAPDLTRMQNIAQMPAGAVPQAQQQAPQSIVGGLVHGVSEMDRYKAAFNKQGPEVFNPPTGPLSALLSPENDNLATRLRWAFQSIGQTPFL